MEPLLALIATVRLTLPAIRTMVRLFGELGCWRGRGMDGWRGAHLITLNCLGGFQDSGSCLGEGAGDIPVWVPGFRPWG